MSLAGPWMGGAGAVSGVGWMRWQTCVGGARGRRGRGWGRFGRRR
jgi:hypothetical protein